MNKLRNPYGILTILADLVIITAVVFLYLQKNTSLIDIAIWLVIVIVFQVVSFIPGLIRRRKERNAPKQDI